MSSAPAALEARVAAIESALSLPGPSAVVASVAAAGELARVTKALERSQYRIVHLERAYDALAARAHAAEAALALAQAPPAQ